LSWKNKVRKKFDCHYEIVDMMADRAGSMPKCTNDDPNNLDLDDDEDGQDFALADDNDDDEEDADVVAIVAPPSDAAAAAPPSSSKKDKKQRKRGGRATLMDDETMKAFASANDMSAKRFREERRHNQRVEEFDNCRLVLEEKAAVAHKLATHVGYVAARVKSVSQYHELKATGMSDEQIIRIVPDLIDIVEIITGKKFGGESEPTIDVDESSDDGGGKPAAEATPERRTSPRRQTRSRK